MDDWLDPGNRHVLVQACSNARTLQAVCELLGLGDPQVSSVPTLIGGAYHTHHPPPDHPPPYFWEKGFEDHEP